MVPHFSRQRYTEWLLLGMLLWSLGLSQCGSAATTEVATAAPAVPSRTATQPPAATPAPSSTPPPTATPMPPLEIIFVNNDSFLITAGRDRILFDPYTNGAPAEIRTLMERGQPPFDDLTLVLVTHEHYDHFAPDLVATILDNNPEALFASTEQCVKVMKALFPHIERTQVLEPQPGERLQATLNGIETEVLNLPHGVPITNLGFILKLDGGKLLHPGDVVNVSDLEAYQLERDDIDVALVPYFYLISAEYVREGKNVVVEAIRPRYVVPIHYSPGKTGLGAILAKVEATVPNSVPFRQSLESWSLP